MLLRALSLQRSTLKKKLSCRDLLNRVRSVKKTKQDNNVTDRISSVYAKTETKLSGPFWPSVVFYEN